MFSTTIRRTRHVAATLAEISSIYCLVRDQSGEGCSTFPMTAVYEDGREVGYVAYNGKVFPGSPHDAIGDRKPLYDPYAPRPVTLAENVGSSFTYPSARPLRDLLK